MHMYAIIQWDDFSANTSIIAPKVWVISCIFNASFLKLAAFWIIISSSFRQLKWKQAGKGKVGCQRN